MTSEEDKLSPEIRFHLIRRMERLKVIALAGPELMPHEAKYLGFHGVAGVILFERNIQSLTQVSELISSVRGRLADEGGQAPLVMVDHEGDFVSELANIIGVPPAPLAIAATGDLDLARQVAFETGQAMTKLGVNTVLAPVADCFSDRCSPITGLRTFGSDPERVAEFVASTIQGFSEAGVLTCAKHFPGHGSTPEDSHETLPEVRKSLDELRAADLVPFRRAIGEGVDMMMMSHVAYAMGSDDIVPASFDPRLIRTVLREEMGFGGVVITDALEMAGARWYTDGRFGGLSGGSEHALLAGVDLLLHSRPVPEMVQMQGESEPVMSSDVIETIIKTLERVVDPSRIDEKLAEAARENEALGNVLGLLKLASERVDRLRARLPVADEATPARSAGSNVIAFNAYPSVPHVYRNVAERSVVAVSDWGDFTPLGPSSRLVVVPVEWHASESLHHQDLDEFIDVVGKRFPRWRRTPLVHEFESLPDGSSQPVIKGGGGGVVDAARFTGSVESAGLEIAADEELAVLLSSRGVPGEEFMAALQSFCDAHSPAVIIVTGWPVTDWVPDTAATLWSIGASAQVAAAVAGILAGELDPAGRAAGLFPA